VQESEVAHRGVELRVVEGEILDVRLDELHAGNPPARVRQHDRREVHRDHLVAPFHQRLGRVALPAAGVEHPRAGGNVGDELGNGKVAGRREQVDVAGGEGVVAPAVALELGKSVECHGTLLLRLPVRLTALQQSPAA